jgi:hypothetical protein
MSVTKARRRAGGAPFPKSMFTFVAPALSTIPPQAVSYAGRVLELE